jgi:hypothetical protein
VFLLLCRRRRKLFGDPKDPFVATAQVCPRARGGGNCVTPGIVHHVPGIVHHVPGIVHHVPGIVHHVPGIVHHVPGIVHPVPGIVHHVPRPRNEFGVRAVYQRTACV